MYTKKWWQDIQFLTADRTPLVNKNGTILNDTINSPALLAAQINDFFISITQEFEPLTQV